MATSAGNAGESNGTAAKRDEFRDVLAACVSEQKLCEPRRLQTEEASTCAKEAVLRTERIAKCARLEVKGLAKLQNIVDEQLRAVNEENYLVGEESPLRRELPPHGMTLLAAFHERRSEKWDKKRKIQSST
mmetsp:Transcript_8511/g.20084  ORF Transcript_8511/g.20084 Transcript_8511/m.20084 type:complete len:131 (-) Transcript_8511:477-869(-)